MDMFIIYISIILFYYRKTHTLSHIYSYPSFGFLKKSRECRLNRRNKTNKKFQVSCFWKNKQYHLEIMCTFEICKKWHCVLNLLPFCDMCRIIIISSCSQKRGRWVQVYISVKYKPYILFLHWNFKDYTHNYYIYILWSVNN